MAFVTKTDLAEKARINGRTEVKKEVLAYLEALRNRYLGVSQTDTVAVLIKLITGITNDIKQIRESPVPPVRPAKEEEDLQF